MLDLIGPRDFRRETMRIYFLLLFILITFAVHTEEVSRVQTKTSDGENLTVVTYRNKPNGLIRREWYGTGPIYSKVIEYFDSSNLKYIERIEYFNVDLSSNSRNKDQFNGEAEYLRIYHTNNHPDNIQITETKSDEENHYYKFYFWTPVMSIVRQYHVITHDKVKKMMISFFENTDENVQNYKKVTDYYNDNGFVYLTVKDFFQNQTGLVEVAYTYVSPHFTQTTIPHQVLKTYVNNPDGLIEVKMVNSIENSSMREEIYDSARSRRGVSKILSYSVNNTKQQDIHFHNERPINGNIYRVERYFNENGSVKSAHFYDQSNILLFEHFTEP